MTSDIGGMSNQEVRQHCDALHHWLTKQMGLSRNSALALIGTEAVRLLLRARDPIQAAAKFNEVTLVGIVTAMKLDITPPDDD